MHDYSAGKVRSVFKRSLISLIEAYALRFLFLYEPMLFSLCPVIFAICCALVMISGKPFHFVTHFVTPCNASPPSPSPVQFPGLRLAPRLDRRAARWLPSVATFVHTNHYPHYPDSQYITSPSHSATPSLPSSRPHSPSSSTPLDSSCSVVFPTPHLSFHSLIMYY